jgi:hypothetical protein
MVIRKGKKTFVGQTILFLFLYKPSIFVGITQYFLAIYFQISNKQYFEHHKICGIKKGLVYVPVELCQVKHKRRKHHMERYSSNLVLADMEKIVQTHIQSLVNCSWLGTLRPLV